MSKQGANRALGLADRVATPVPPSGPRARGATGELPIPLPLESLVMPDPSRMPFDSLDKTDVKAPNPMLLAMTRGNLPKRPRRRLWFGLGMASGALAMWLAIGDVAPAYRAARAFTAHALASLSH